MAGAEDTLKDFWTSRPRRPRRGRKIAGVAAGIANRYSIDPVLVRVIFVVSAFFGGAGLVVYLLGWLFFPEQNDEVAPFSSMVGRGRSSTSTIFTVLLCLLMIPAVAYTFNNANGSGVVGLLLLATAIYLIHRHRAPLGQQTANPTPVPPAAHQATTPLGPLMPEPGAPAAEQEQRAGPPAWDPLGAAPFAWDLPEPAPVKVEPEPPAPRNRSRVGGITLGAALAVVGGCALLQPYAPWLSGAHIIGIALAVIGLGMVGGAFVRGGRGLIGLAVPLALAGFVFTSTSWGPGGMPNERWGNVSAKPASVSGVDSVYSVAGGTIDLDLSSLPQVGTVRTNVSVGLGNVSVIVPPDADVELTCSAGVGSVECLGQNQNAMDAQVRVTDTGTDGPGGLRIVLDARANSGTVEVRRG